jgi:phosphatidate cytidylyltransferase
MKIRIIVAVICVPLLFVVLFYLPPVAVTVVVAVIAAVAAYELLRAIGACAAPRLCIYAVIAAAIIPTGLLIGREALFSAPF